MAKMIGRARGKFSPVVEELDGRQLLSVAVLPGRINIKTTTKSQARMTVRIISDDTAESTTVLGADPSTLVYSAVAEDGNTTTLTAPVKVQSKDVNGDGVADLLLKFKRSALGGLAAGDYQFQVAATDDVGTATSLAGAFTIFTPGKPNR